MIEDQVITGWVEVGGIAVLAEYDPRERWNGWLGPRLDPHAAVTVLTSLERLQPGTLGWTFRLDGGLLLIDLEYVALGETLDASTNVCIPDPDGLHALGSHFRRANGPHRIGTRTPARAACRSWSIQSCAHRALAQDMNL